MTPQQLHESYKELQREFGSRNESFKSIQQRFEPYGGPEEFLNRAEKLLATPEVQEAVRNAEYRSQVGDPHADYDPETQKALDIVDRRAEQKAQEAVERVLQDYINPMQEEKRTELVEGYMDELIKEFPDVDKYQDAMSEIAGELPDMDRDPTYEDIKALFFMSLAQTGDLKSYAAKYYEQDLREKQKKSTEKPGSPAGAGVPKQATSLEEAFAQAKKQLNM
jgi:hypothetical protein